ncbi:flavin-containing monooxygenase [Albidovulum sediminicola]|uniref:NAD(P)/FAD-dependent oxidoreductase n=1 Tax=Albidovulum sediminicola TaxID=2984331 RepID=A0ABT2YZA9_9RHOB|nr:NAD(P)/FAD-dependent oxidoreductase [Defluviimonas sp. WL0075]MCV2864199.1 NAD(P)/FAD-dependent oxidoreductase [Defluviimonas sp. WL0075]
MSRSVDLIIIGAGPAGLALSWSMRQRGVDHLVLERGRVGERWHSERWPGLRLLTPNWMNALPGMATVGPVGGFMSASDFAGRLTRYGTRIAAPVVSGCAVQSVTQDGDGFRVLSTAGEWRCRALVIATGACDQAAIPDWASALPRQVWQVAPSHYRGPDSLPQGNVLVVGASATGAQLASEIQASGRKVTLSVGRHVRAPRRYRGRDVFDWLDGSGFLREARSRATSRPVALPSLQLVGRPDNRDIDLAMLAAQGVRIAGRALGVSQGRVRFAPTLATECAASEVRRRKLLTVIDRHIAGAGIEAPKDPQAWEARVPPVAQFAGADLPTQEIATVVWATGFRRSYPWLRVPVLDAAGEIVSDGGVTPVDGLFTLGLPFMRHRSSAFIHGFGRDAEAIASAISHHLDKCAARAA